MERLLCASTVLGAGEAAGPQVRGAHGSVGETGIHPLWTRVDVKMPLR